MAWCGALEGHVFLRFLALELEGCLLVGQTWTPSFAGCPEVLGGEGIGRWSWAGCEGRTSVLRRIHPSVSSSILNPCFKVLKGVGKKVLCDLDLGTEGFCRLNPRSRGPQLRWAGNGHRGMWCG